MREVFSTEGGNLFLKRILFIFANIMLCCIWISCSAKNSGSTVSRELGIDADGGSEILNYDTHSGNGDGISCIAMTFRDDNVLQQIDNNSSWKEFPLDKAVETLVYGISNGDSSTGPFLTDNNGKTLVPQILNGYYILIDRQNSDAAILERKSFNLSLGLYDTDTKTIYFCKLDT